MHLFAPHLIPDHTKPVDCETQTSVKHTFTLRLCTVYCFVSVTLYSLLLRLNDFVQFIASSQCFHSACHPIPSLSAVLFKKVNSSR